VTSLSTEYAETLALRALAWLAGNDDLMPVFMGHTGVAEADLRDQAGSPFFLGSVLDFILMDDVWVIAFCDAHGLSYEHVAVARAALPGGDEVHWT
jgi:hypothetical protein